MNDATNEMYVGSSEIELDESVLVKAVRSVMYDGIKEEFKKVGSILEKLRVSHPEIETDALGVIRALNDLKESLEAESESRRAGAGWRLTEMGRLHEKLGDEDYLRALEANWVRRQILQKEKDKERNKTMVQKRGRKTKYEAKKLFENLDLLSVKKYRSCLPNGEARECLVFDPALTGESVKHDVALGATQYSAIANAEPVDLASKVIAFRVKKLEDGYNAAAYYWARQVEMEGLDKDSDCIDPDHFNLTKCDLDDTEFINVCPIIGIGELWHDPFDNYGVGFGSPTGAVRGIRDQNVPYWANHTGPAILVCSNTTMGYDPESKRLTDAISALGEKKCIYVIYQECNDFFSFEGMEENLSHGDVRLLNAVLEYDAVLIDIKITDRTPHLLKVLDGMCDKYRLKIPDDYPREELVARLARTYSDMRAEGLENLIRREARRSKDHVLSRDVLKLLGHVESDDELQPKGWALLDSMEGMTEVKQEIKALVDSIKLSKARRANGLKSEPIVSVLFTGAPGTGKSETGRALSHILASEDLLPGKRFTCITGAGLQAEYVGQTTGKVKEIFDTSDVILIDEAYSLSDLVKQGIPYAGEALAEICVQLEEIQKKGNKLVLWAGYGGSQSSAASNKMAEFLESNPGIKSRISGTVEFKSYTPEDMGSIFLKICSNNGYSFTPEETEELRQEAVTYFTQRVKDSSFGNGREARALVGEAQRQAASRIMNGKSYGDVPVEELSSLTIEDVRKAIASLKKMTNAQNGKASSSIRMIG